MFFILPSTVMFVQYIFSDKTIVFTSTCTFPSLHLKCKKITGFLSAKSLLILQIKVRHKVLNRSERVKYMYTCILFVDLTMMIKIQPVGCPVAISLSVRPILFVKSITSISILCLSFLLKFQPHSVFWLEIRFDLEPIV